MDTSMDIHTLSIDSFRQIALLLPYQDLLALLRAYPERLKDLNEHFWACKGAEEYRATTSSRRDYVMALTYAGDVVEGSEEHLIVDICAMRAAAKKDRQLIDYFLKKGANRSFVYYGLISNTDRKGTSDLLREFEKDAKKSGYFYHYGLTLGEIWNPDYMKKESEDEENGPRGCDLVEYSHGEIEGHTRAMLERGLLHLALQEEPVEYKFDSYDLRHLTKHEIRGVAYPIVSEQATHSLAEIMNSPEIPRQYIADLVEYTASEEEYVSFHSVGFCVGSSKYPDRDNYFIEEIKKYYKCLLDDCDAGDREYIKETSRESLDEFLEGYHWGLAAEARYPIPHEWRQGLYSTIRCIFVSRGYIDPLKALLEWEKQRRVTTQKVIEWDYVADCKRYGLESLIDVLGCNMVKKSSK